MALPTIQRRSDFLSAAAKGRSFVTGTFILQMHKRDDTHPIQGGARFGFTVTRKMGNAVVRNRIKRRLREAVRLAVGELAMDGHDYVLISRHKALACPFEDLLRDMRFAFSKIPTMTYDNTKPRKPKSTP